MFASLIFYVGTSSSPRRMWRKWALLYIACLAGSEFGLLALPQEYFAVLQIPAQFLDIQKVAGLIRHMIFMFLTISILVVQRSEPTLEERIRRYLDVDQSIMSKWKAFQIQDLAILDDETLLRQFITFHKGRQLDRQKIQDDPEVEEIRKRIMARANDVVFSGMNEGDDRKKD